MRRHGTTPPRARVGLALAGGGPLGAMYELGALRALEEAVDGLDLNDLSSYVGVSAGSFIAACLANGLTTRQLLASVAHAGGPFALRPEVFFKPAYSELARRALKVPRLGVEALRMFTRHAVPRATSETISLLSQALPVGVFDNEPIRAYLASIFSTEGCTDDFRQLRHRLTVVAADLETGTALRFGDPGLDDVPISRAVQASTAAPGVYPPVEIKDHVCVDGVLLKTVHASVALEQGARLLFCVNPIVPVDVSAAARAGRVPRDILTDLGLPAVMSQTFRTLIHSRLEVGLSRYGARFPDADIVLLQPRTDEYSLFFANVFSFRSRVAICERGYAATRRDLVERFAEIGPVLEGHGLSLRADVLFDETRDLWAGCGLHVTPVATRQNAAVHALDRALTTIERAVAADDRADATRTHPAARATRRG